VVAALDPETEKKLLAIEKTEKELAEKAAKA